MRRKRYDGYSRLYPRRTLRAVGPSSARTLQIKASDKRVRA